MQDAKMTVDQPKPPTADIDTDDLVFLIGTKEIEKLGQSKRLKMAAQAIANLQQSAGALKTQLEAAQKALGADLDAHKEIAKAQEQAAAEVLEFKKRNETLGRKHDALTALVAELRQEVKALKAANLHLQKAPPKPAAKKPRKSRAKLHIK